jgi:hypothetical protein
MRRGKQMKTLKSTSIILFLIPFLFILVFGCSGRIEEPVLGEDATIVYPPKQDDDVFAKINFSRRIDDKTARLIGEGTVFSMIEDGILYAVADIVNQKKHLETGLMFHLEWIGPDGTSVFCKKVDGFPDDSTSSLISSISISPEKRISGEYLFRVYYFRELIAEKQFTLLPALIVTPAIAESLAPQITLYRYVSKKTGELIGEGTVFEIKQKGWVRANVKLNQRFALGEQELIFRINWLGPAGESIYSKRYDLFPGDSSSTISSSISISPDNRVPGEYSFQLLLFDKLIAEQDFELR